MKKIFNTIAIFYVVLTTVLFNKIIATNIGLIAYTSTTVILMLVVLYINYRKKL
jgi:hypothetical protein